MTRIRRLISSLTGRFLPGDADDYKPGDTIAVTQRRGSYLTPGDRQKLSSALAVTYRTRTGAPFPVNSFPTTPLERAVMDLLNKAG